MAYTGRSENSPTVRGVALSRGRTPPADLCTILPTSGSPSGAEDPSLAGSPASRKNPSNPPGVMTPKTLLGEVPTFLKRVRGAPGSVHARRPRACRDGALAEQELDLPLQHAERLVLVGVQVRGRAAATRRGRLLDHRVGPVGVLGGEHHLDQVPHQPYRLPFARGGVGCAALAF